MSDLYKTKVNNNLEFELTSKDVEALDTVQESNSKLHILKNNTSYKAEITNKNFNSKSYQVKVNNNKYNVIINNDLDVLIKQMGFEIGATKKVNEIKAPMPGLILDINIAIGQEVSENDPLLILEAMKMENILTAPRDGVIKSITVNKGEAVEKNKILIAFE